MSRRHPLSLLLAAALLAGCSMQSTEVAPDWSKYDPFVTSGPGTAIPLSTLLPPTRGAGTPISLPTPNPGRRGQTPSQPSQHVVQDGDTLGGIASLYGISVEALMQANGLTDPDSLSVGQVLTIPVPTPGAPGPDYKIIPDSELVYGPASVLLDVNGFILGRNGYLAAYQEQINGETLTAAQIILKVSQNYSVNPRLLLALIEYRSGWLTQANPDPATLDYPLRYYDDYHAGLYRQLTFAANELNRGYYLWRVNAVTNWVLADGSVVPPAQTINAGTAGVQNLLAKLDDRATWEADVSINGVFKTYYELFGFPFDLSIDPLVPGGLKQPAMQLPFARGETWSFTGGPHGGWDDGSGWAALDFAPPGLPAGCTPSDNWVEAVADGVIVRTGEGQVIEDLDGDGLEQTGWVVLYMHVEYRDRVQPGTAVKAGDRIGHPSCEGGISNATHLHLARKYNGEWIPADGNLPYNLDGWISVGTGVEYDGYLQNGNSVIEAIDGQNELNQITR
jgi:murein DD-endopeptidase MepM/ murein hydrolase activator NlpD